MTWRSRDSSSCPARPRGRHSGGRRSLGAPASLAETQQAVMTARPKFPSALRYMLKGSHAPPGKLRRQEHQASPVGAAWASGADSHCITSFGLLSEFHLRS